MSIIEHMNERIRIEVPELPWVGTELYDQVIVALYAYQKGNPAVASTLLMTMRTDSSEKGPLIRKALPIVQGAISHIASINSGREIYSTNQHHF